MSSMGWALPHPSSQRFRRAPKLARDGANGRPLRLGSAVCSARQDQVACFDLLQADANTAALMACVASASRIAILVSAAKCQLALSMFEDPTIATSPSTAMNLAWLAPLPATFPSGAGSVSGRVGF